MADYKATQYNHPMGAMPPGHKAVVGNLQTFELPETLSGSAADKALGKSMIDAWKRDGILQISMDPINRKLADAAFLCSKKFFGLDYKQKAACLDDQSFAGYIASGEEITDNIADYSEIFTVTKELALTDPRVQQKWPCHGPNPWPFTQMKTIMQAYMDYLGESGEKMLSLIAWGLGLEDGNALTRYTQDGWHHMRVLRFPQTDKTNGKGKAGRGIGSHTDYGLLVIAAQDAVGGLFIRPPIEGEEYANWKTTAAGKHEDTDGWVYVPPTPDVFTVFPVSHSNHSFSSKALLTNIPGRHDAIHHQLIPPLNTPQGRTQHPRALRLRLLPRAQLLRRHEAPSGLPGRSRAH